MILVDPMGLMECVFPLTPPGQGLGTEPGEPQHKKDEVVGDTGPGE